ncbi:unnamed protein product, partial [Iphiclides podalirius]
MKGDVSARSLNGNQLVRAARAIRKCTDIGKYFRAAAKNLVSERIFAPLPTTMASNAIQPASSTHHG